MGEHQPVTDFQRGLRRFSYLLLKVALTLTAVIIVTNLLLRRPLIESALFGLAIAVGITPQLLPAVVSTRPQQGGTRSGDIVCRRRTGLTLEGFLIFAGTPKANVRDSLTRLKALGVEVKVATGVNPRVAEKVCEDIGLPSKGTITGAELQRLNDEELTATAQRHTTFARISPERRPASFPHCGTPSGRSDFSATESTTPWLYVRLTSASRSTPPPTLPKDAADVVLLQKDLGMLAEGQRIFAKTIKYVLMVTSSNFGKMFSAAAASAIFSFLPMLPSQILLNNLLYDTSQLAIPTDRVDDEQLHAPAHWDVAFIRRFILSFGPINSFDFLTFGLMLGVLHAGPVEFRTGWLVESLATRTLIIFAIRTRRVPFLRSRPGALLTAATLSNIVLGVALTVSPLAADLGFRALPWQFFAALLSLTVAYLVLVEITKRWFYADALHLTHRLTRTRGRSHRIHRLAARFSRPAVSVRRSR